MFSADTTDPTRKNMIPCDPVPARLLVGYGVSRVARYRTVERSRTRCNNTHTQAHSYSHTHKHTHTRGLVSCTRECANEYAHDIVGACPATQKSSYWPVTPGTLWHAYAHTRSNAHTLSHFQTQKPRIHVRY